MQKHNSHFKQESVIISKPTFDHKQGLGSSSLCWSFSSLCGSCQAANKGGWRDPSRLWWKLSSYWGHTGQKSFTHMWPVSWSSHKLKCSVGCEQRFSPAGVDHHNELVPLRAVSNRQLDLTQGVLAGCQATKKHRGVSQRHSQRLQLNLYSTLYAGTAWQVVG